MKHYIGSIGHFKYSVFLVRNLGKVTVSTPAGEVVDQFNEGFSDGHKASINRIETRILTDHEG